MEQKPVIQYVGQFYVYGSEAKAPKKVKEEPRHTLPERAKPVKEHCVYIDPVAVCGIVLAAVLLVVLVSGAFQLKSAMEAYNRQTELLAAVQRENAILEHQYRTGIDEDAVRERADELGLVEKSEADNRRIHVNAPEGEKEETLLQRVWWHLRGLLYGVNENKAVVFERQDLLDIEAGTYTNNESGADIK